MKKDEFKKLLKKIEGQNSSEKTTDLPKKKEFQDLSKNLLAGEDYLELKKTTESPYHRPGSSEAEAFKKLQTQNEIIKDLDEKDAKKQKIRAKQAELEKNVAEKRAREKSISDLRKSQIGKFTKTKSLLGILPAAAATALSMFAPESKAATVAKTAARVIDEGDPTSLLFPEGAGEGEDREVQKLNEENKKKFFDNLMKEGMKNQKIRSEKETELKKEVEPIVKILGGDPDISSSKALKSSGEKPSPDLEEMEDSLSYEDYLKKKKRQLGY